MVHLILLHKVLHSCVPNGCCTIQFSERHNRIEISTHFSWTICLPLLPFNTNESERRQTKINTSKCSIYFQSVSVPNIKYSFTIVVKTIIYAIVIWHQNHFSLNRNIFLSFLFPLKIIIINDHNFQHSLCRANKFYGFH